MQSIKTLHRQERIFGRAGVEIPRSILAQRVRICGAQLQSLVDALKTKIFNHSVTHADETPVERLKPGNKKTHRAYEFPGAVYSLVESFLVVSPRHAVHARSRVMA